MGNVSADVARPEPGQVWIYGLKIDALDEDGLLRRIFDDLDRGTGGWVVTPNVDILRQAHADPGLNALISRSTLRVADGAPIEWAAKISRQEIPGRLPGASLFWTLAEEADRRGRSIMLMGGRETAAELAAQRLVETYPDLIVYHFCPPVGFENDPHQMAALRHEITSLQPDLVYFGLGAPKQELLMDALHAEYPAVWFFGLGAAIDFASELVPRAPEWMQREGLEWLFRLLREPQRLGRRYLILGIPFTIRLLAWAMRARRRGTPQVALTPAG